ncbi:hypothetical protein [Microbacterium aurugineum]|uniref:hypothetical protein n=1 Tax=Microbacterium aurugineum TaxID=2851642 RepID=UPI0020C05FD7|nr:hypothetical protein [Microbacterium aurugineum]MCK8477212.1 hypothetical protein [Microbacterium aurugineum]
MTWILELPFERPPKGLSANDRAHWAVKSKATAVVRAQVKHLALAAGIEPMQRCQVEVIWVVKDKRRRDADNAAPLAKAIFDGLAADKGVSAHIVADDDPAHMVKLMPRIDYRPDATPHFEVIVTDLTHRSDAVDQLTKERLT